MSVIDLEVWMYAKAKVGNSTVYQVRSLSLDLSESKPIYQQKDMISCILEVFDKVWISGVDGVIRVFDKTKKKHIENIKVNSAVSCLQLIQFYQHGVFVSAVVWVACEGVIYRYNVADGKCIGQEPSHHRGLIINLAVSLDKIWSCSNSDKVIGIFDAVSGKFETMVEGHDSKVTYVSRFGKYVWSASWDGTIYLWNPTKNAKGQYYTIMILPDIHQDAITILYEVRKEDNKIEIWSGSLSNDATICVFKLTDE